MARAKTSRIVRSFSDDNRKRLMRAVMAACHRLDIDEEDRRDLQMHLTGKSSMAKMSSAEIGTLLDHLNRVGHYDRSSARPWTSKIRALWWSLYWLGEIHTVSDQALETFIARQTGVQRLQFLGHRDAPAVIEALKSWLERACVIWPLDAEGNGDRLAVLAAIMRRLDDVGFPERDGVPIGGAGEIDEAIRKLGKRLRRHLHPDALGSLP